MEPDITNGDETLKQDEDVTFELEKEPEIVPLTQTAPKDKEIGETIIPVKEDTLGKSDFPALTELEKQPKLPSEE